VLSQAFGIRLTDTVVARRFNQVISALVLKKLQRTAGQSAWLNDEVKTTWC